MVQDIDKFDIYQEVVSEYGNLDAYKDDEKKLRKEAVGKLIAQIVVNKFQEKNTSLFHRAVLMVKQLFNWITAKFGGDKAKAINDAIATYEEAANMILQNDTTQLMTLENYQRSSEGVNKMYQISPEDDLRRTEVLKKLSTDRVRKEQKGYTVLETLEQLKVRVTDQIKRINFEIYHRYDRTDKKSPLS